MSKQKHTSGPWEVGYESFQVTAAKGRMNVCDIRGWGYLTGKGSLGLPFDEAKKIQDANARLIAAAPDMLALLKSLSEKLSALSLDVTEIDELIKKVEK